MRITSGTEKMMDVGALSAAMAEAAEPDAGSDPPASAPKAKKSRFTGKRKTTKKAAAKAPAAKAADDGAKIVWLGKENPFREGTGAHERTELCRRHNGKLISTFLQAGGRRSTLATLKRMKLITVG
jgi:hypothetical protein